MMSLAGLNIESIDLALLILVATTVGCLALWRFIRWFSEEPRPPEPWDEQVAAAIAQDDATPLCCRCLQPHPPFADFCPECGAPVGTYTNLLPFPYIFSLGDLLRIGTGGVFNRTPVTLVGFVLVSLAEYTVFAPFYWLMFMKNLERQRLGRSGSSPVTADQV